MTYPCQFPLGEVPLDSAQTVRKAWDNDKLGHRVVPVYEPYSYAEYTYNTDGSINTVSFYYNYEEEISTAGFVADVSSSLNGKSFTFYHPDDTQTIIYYSVNGAATLPNDTDTKNYILVNILANDVGAVVAKATELAIRGESDYGTKYTITFYDNILKIINTSKGNVTDITDSGTGFEFNVIQQGVTNLIDTYTYVYDTDGNITSITTLSGENLFGVVDIKNQLNAKRDNVAISNGTYEASVDVYNALKVGVSEKTEAQLELRVLLGDILKELKIMNIYNQLITDHEIDDKDL